MKRLFIYFKTAFSFLSGNDKVENRGTKRKRSDSDSSDSFNHTETNFSGFVKRLKRGAMTIVRYLLPEHSPWGLFGDWSQDWHHDHDDTGSGPWYADWRDSDHHSRGKSTEFTVL